MQTTIPKIALVGCGYIAHIHHKFLRRIGLVVNAVCDSSEIRGKEFASQYGIKNVSNNVDELFEKYKPDVAHILVPPQMHFLIAKKALMNGCHVFIEKPICSSADEFYDLIQIANEKGLHISVDHTRVYNPLIIEARKRIAAGDFGKITEIRYEYDDPSAQETSDVEFPLQYKKGTPAWFRSLKGGVISDLLPHPLSVLLSFDDNLRIEDISGRARSDIIEYLSVRLCSPSLAAHIAMSLHVTPLRNRMSIFCEKGTIFIDLRNMYSTYLPDRGLPNIVSRVLDTFSASCQTQLQFLKSVLGMISGKTHPYSGLDHILKGFYSKVIGKESSDQGEYDAIGKVVSCQEEIVNWFKNKYPPQKDLRTEKRKTHNNNSNILVTGGTGFIGRYLVNELLEQGQRVRIFCRNAHGAHNFRKEVDVFVGDLREKSTIEAALDGIDTVFHCAAAMSGDLAEFLSSTVGGTENLLEACAKKNIKKLVYLSSIGILNYNKLRNGGVVDEESPVEDFPDRRGHYTKAKLIAENKVEDFQKNHPNIRVIIVRPGLVYGKESDNNLSNAGVLLGRWLLVFGMGSRYLGLIYVKNLAKALTAIGAECKGSLGTLVNIVDPDQPTVSEYLLVYNRVANKRVKVVYIPTCIWNMVFCFVDVALMLKNRKKSFYLYKFASNSKRVKFRNRVFGKEKIVEEYVDWATAVMESTVGK